MGVTEIVTVIRDSFFRSETLLTTQNLRLFGNDAFLVNVGSDPEFAI